MKMEIPVFGEITEGIGEPVIADFHHFYYSLEYKEGVTVALHVCAGPEKTPRYEQITKQAFKTKFVNAINWLKTIKQIVTANSQAFKFYLEKGRMYHKLHAYQQTENIGLFLELGESMGKSLSQTFTYQENCPLADQPFQNRPTKEYDVQDIPIAAWAEAWDSFSSFFAAFRKDLNKPLSAFPTSQGLTDQEKRKLVRTCYENGIPYDVNKDHKGTNIRFERYRYYHHETATKALEALIQERSFTFLPSISLRPGDQLPY